MTVKKSSKVRLNASALLSRLNMAMRAGFSFSGRRDIYQAYGYPRNLTTADLYAKYSRQDLTKRVVDMPPEKTWAEVPTIAEPQEIRSKWEEFAKSTSLWQKIVQADRLCAFGPFSVLMLGMSGRSETPAPAVKNASGFLYVQAYGGDSIKAETFESDTQNPRFGLPLTYQLNVNPNGTGQTIRVHHSRLVHITDSPLQGLIEGIPRMHIVYNILDDLLKIGGGSAELYWLTANRGMQVDVDKEMELDEADAAALADELDEYQHQLRRYVRTRGVKITSLGSEVADPRGVFQVLLSLLAAATGIPQRILIGSEAGQLASEQDRANWADHISSRRVTFAEPYVLRPILNALEGVGYLPKGASKETKFLWNEAFQPSPLERSQINAANARAVVNLSARAQYGNPLISNEEARTLLGFSEEVPSGHTMPETIQKGGVKQKNINPSEDPATASPNTVPQGGESDSATPSVTVHSVQ